ncbi:MAG: hypothetical protein ISS28_07015 [Candidatus Cloacimonetes bacterium]|nr:hypothetical protein [Candidatus Cloacimonadota bacterium]MBL7086828.1 hypothetical protein [Candidatus Cloacimonadota bacterium]
MSDRYILENGEVILFSEIYKIGKMEDIGQRKLIEPPYWRFTITLKNGEEKHITEYYHFSDWGQARIKLEKIRNELIQSFEKYKESSKN